MAGARRPRFTALGVSIGIHAVFAFLLLMWAGLKTESVATKAPPIRTDLVFLQQSGTSGGGGGNPAPAAPRRIEIPQHAAPILVIEATAVPPEPLPQLNVPIQATSATLLQGSGTSLSAPPGPGGGGNGPGLGPGEGPGVGPGKKGGIGGDDGGGVAVTGPIPVKQPRPAFTPGAMAARIQGTVTMEIEVRADGTVGNVKIVRSLDRTYGLDAEAIRTARLWTFIPAKNASGKPVDVIATLVLEFNLR